MIVNKYNNGSGGGSGERGPQGYQGPEGPQGPQGVNGQDGAQGPQGENGINQDPALLKSVSAAPETMGLNDVAVLGNNLSQLTGYEDVVSAYTLVKMYNGTFVKEAGEGDYVYVTANENTFTIGGSYINTPFGDITPGSEVYTDWTEVTNWTGGSTGIMMKYDAGNDELDLRVEAGLSVEGEVVNKSGAELGDLSFYVEITSVEEHFQGDPIYEPYAKRGVLKSSSGTPENIVAGDVYAVHILPFSGDMISVSVNDDISSYKAKKGLFYFDSQVSNCYGVQANGDWRGLCYDGNGNWDNWNGVFCSPTDGDCIVEFAGLKVAIYLEGDYLVYEIIEGDGYISSLNSDTNVSAYVINNEVKESCKVFQADIATEPNVKIELEGNARIDGTLDDPEQVITNNDGQMKISFYDPSIVMGNVCDLGSWGTYFHLFYDGGDDAWTLFDSDEENILIKIGDGESDSANFGDGNVYLSYSGGVLTAYTDNDKGWEHWDMGDTHRVVIANELAKAEDLPTKKQLLPQGWNAAEVLMSNGSEETPIWFERGSLIADGMREAYDYQEGNGPMVLERDSYWEIGWKKLDKTILNAKDELPIQSEDGAVYALSTSGYGIYQAQSAHTGYEWFNLVDKTFPQGVVTKVRVPYNDDGESNICHFKTDPNGSGEWNLYWHPEDTSFRHWDGVDYEEQNDGEFSITDQWGNTAVATKVGDYIEVVFGAPLYDGDQQISTYRNTEVYTEGDIADYRRVAFYDEIGGGGSGSQGPQGPQGAEGAQGPQGPMPSGAVTSSTITTIWSGSQSDYNNLGTYDNNTFYVII